MAEIKKELSGVLHAFGATKKMKLFSIWLILIILLCIFWIFSGKPNEVTVAVSTLVCGSSTVAFWIYRKDLAARVENWQMKPWKKFVLIGSAGALWVEFIFWFFEKVFGAVGVAASPNLLMDYVGTMPWYVLMLLLLWKVQNRYGYSVREMLILGGVYELGADGFFASLSSGNFPRGFLMALIAIPLFVVVYSIIIMPATYLMRNNTKTGARSTPLGGEKNFRRYACALLPLAGLIPYLMLFFLIAIAAASA